MKSAAVTRKRVSLETKVEKLHREIKKLQADCPHEFLRYKQEGSTGNWDRDSDSYWADWFCPDCHMKKTTDQDEMMDEMKERYPHARKICRYSHTKLFQDFYGKWKTGEAI